VFFYGRKNPINDPLTSEFSGWILRTSVDILPASLSFSEQAMYAVYTFVA
jgi:hypothetical protein